MLMHYVAARRAGCFALGRLASMNLANATDKDVAFSNPLGESGMGMHDKPLEPKGTAKTELAKMGKGQPIDDVAMWEEMESDRMDRLIATTAGGGKADQDHMTKLAGLKPPE